MGTGNGVETVFIPETDRGTLCISSQVGCALECTFCSTGRQGFNRNLSTAEIIGQYTRKGSKLSVEGRLQTRKWTDQSGQQRYTTEIVADNIQMLDSRGGGEGSFGGNGSGNYPGNRSNSGGYGQQGGGYDQDYGGSYDQDYGAPSGGGNRPQPPTPNKPVPPQNNTGGVGGPTLDQDNFDDDIPF